MSTDKVQFYMDPTFWSTILNIFKELTPDIKNTTVNNRVKCEQHIKKTYFVDDIKIKYYPKDKTDSDDHDSLLLYYKDQLVFNINNENKQTNVEVKNIINDKAFNLVPNHFLKFTYNNKLVVEKLTDNDGCCNNYKFNSYYNSISGNPCSITEKDNVISSITHSNGKATLNINPNIKYQTDKYSMIECYGNGVRLHKPQEIAESINNLSESLIAHKKIKSNINELNSIKFPNELLQLCEMFKNLN